MPGQYWFAPMPPFHVGDGTAVTASATLTELTPTPQIVIPAPLLNEFAGKRIDYQAWGHYTTTGTPGTIIFDLKLGPTGAIGSMGTSVVTTSALTWILSSTNRFWHIEGNVQVRTLSGATSTVVGFMDINGITGGNVDTPAAVTGTAAGSTVAVDVTQARAIALGATLSAASQSITCRYFGVRLVN